MGKTQPQQLPPDLERGRSRFQAWRGQRKVGGRIPHALWAMAVRLAKAHGVGRTAAALGLDYYRLKELAGADASGLKELAEADASGPRSSGPAFVELTSPGLVGKECRLELDNGAGATMRVHLVGYDAADIESLSRSFWDAP